MCARRGPWCWGFATRLESQLSITFPPSGLSLEQELLCAGRDEQPDIWVPTEGWIHLKLCLQPQYPCRYNSTYLLPLDVLSKTHFLKIWDVLIDWFWLTCPLDKEFIRQMLSSRAWDPLLLAHQFLKCLLLLRDEYFSGVIFHQGFCCCSLHKRGLYLTDIFPNEHLHE